MSQVGPAIPTPFGNLVVRSSSGGGFWLTLPTGSAGMRAFMAGLAINKKPVFAACLRATLKLKFPAAIPRKFGSSLLASSVANPTFVRSSSSLAATTLVVALKNVATRMRLPSSDTACDSGIIKMVRAANACGKAMARVVHIPAPAASLVDLTPVTMAAPVQDLVRFHPAVRAALSMVLLVWDGK
ncbi:hypothetical protein MCOR31_008534 [Pyricularia oryzae]|nr:hypothetical protein MCOR30_011730 [Pyricularia oryzae]KAI6361756.1 hypothetical protein MCOR31_008534 [Pyricularia oryzae]KAI6381524.1 hypothetical protein MCOR24_011877 [Pyricularia oryzae]